MADPHARIDLHAHTHVSDGTLSPSQLVELAARNGLAALAVTDHDHMGGLAEARQAGDRLGVEIIPGIELSAHEDGHEVHLLGYLLDERDAALAARLDSLRVARRERAQRMVERLQASGQAITLADVEREAGDDGAARSVGRPHVARALMRAGIVGSIEEAFDGFLAEGRPGYVEKARLSCAEAIALVHAAGGVAVLAHPVTLPAATRESLVRRLAAAGLDGIEVMHSKHGDAERAAFAALANELDLVPTGGSDFHGTNKPDVALGSGRDDNVDVRGATLDALRQRQAARGKR